jgi:hypothetical protein
MYRGPGLGLVGVAASEVGRRVRSGAGKTSMFDAMEIVLPIGEVVCTNVVGGCADYVLWEWVALLSLCAWAEENS